MYLLKEVVKALLVLYALVFNRIHRRAKTPVATSPLCLLLIFRKPLLDEIVSYPATKHDIERNFIYEMLMENTPQMIVGSLYVVYVQDKGLSTSIYFAFANNIGGLIVKLVQLYFARNSDAPDPNAAPQVELHEILNPISLEDGSNIAQVGSNNTQVMVLGNDGGVIMRRSTGGSTRIGSNNTKDTNLAEMALLLLAAQLVGEREVSS